MAFEQLGFRSKPVAHLVFVAQQLSLYQYQTVNFSLSRDECFRKHPSFINRFNVSLLWTMFWSSFFVLLLLLLLRARARALVCVCNRPVVIDGLGIMVSTEEVLKTVYEDEKHLTL